MSDTRQLRDTWTMFLSKSRGGPPLATKSFAEYVDSSINVVIEGLRGEFVAKGRIDDEEAKRILRDWRIRSESFFVGRDGNLNKIKGDYARVYEHLERLRDERRQQNWATSVDYLKMYFWRTLQGATFAGIVLATGYLAKVWEIPLPFLLRTI